MKGFIVSKGQILDPSESIFVAKGINLYDSQIKQASNILAAFPGINMVRVAVQNYASASALTSFVNTMTSHGVVVEIEDHVTSGGSTNNVLTGSALAKELDWYISIATAFKDNPYVWYGTMNEPDNVNNQATTTDQEVAIYNVIRNAGAASPIMMSMIGGFSTTVSGGLTASAYRSMINIVWDAHFYNWQTNHNGAQAASTLSGEIANAQLIHSANGMVPVIIGEYGSSQADLLQVEKAVQGSGYGSLAWAWNSGWASLSPTGVGTSLTASGKEVAGYIASKAPTSPPSPPPDASPNDTVITGLSGSITDNAGNKWTITAGGQVAINGTVDATTKGVLKLAWVNSNVWQENNQHRWWEKTSSTVAWSPPGGTLISPLPAGTATNVSADQTSDTIVPQFITTSPPTPSAKSVGLPNLATSVADMPPLPVSISNSLPVIPDRDASMISYFITDPAPSSVVLPSHTV